MCNLTQYSVIITLKDLQRRISISRPTVDWIDLLLSEDSPSIEAHTLNPLITIEFLGQYRTNTHSIVKNKKGTKTYTSPGSRRLFYNPRIETSVYIYTHTLYPLITTEFFFLGQ